MESTAGADQDPMVEYETGMSPLLIIIIIDVKLTIQSGNYYYYGVPYGVILLLFTWADFRWTRVAPNFKTSSSMGPVTFRSVNLCYPWALSAWSNY